MHRILRSFALLFLFLLLTSPTISSPASAQDGQATVRLDGRALFRVSSDEETPAEARAERIEQRLQLLLRNSDVHAPAMVTRAGENRVVSIAGVPVVTIQPIDAEENLANIDTLAQQWARSIDAELERARARRLGPGGRLVAETGGVLQSAFARILDSIVSVVPRVIAAIIVITVFAALAWLVHRGLRLLFRKTISDRTLENLIKQLSYYSIIVIGVMIAADALGFSPQALVTGLGLTGLVLGFALKDILSNFVSGLLILALRPFEIGNQIVVGDTEGAVERIELRATQIRTYDGRVALVPNAEVFTSRIVNNTADPVRRGNVHFMVGYDINLKKVVEMLRSSIAEVPGVLPGRPVVVRIEDLGADAMVLNIGFWTDSQRSDFKETSSAVRAKVVMMMEALGIPPPRPDLRSIAPSDPAAWRAIVQGRASSVEERDGQ